MRTGFAAVRVGIVMFTIPFVFAWYPELLLIEQAVTITNDAGQRVLIEGYSGETDWGQLTLLLGRLALVLYLMASALTRFDKSAISTPELVLRLVCCVLILWKSAIVVSVGVAIATPVLAWHYFSNSRLSVIDS